MPGQTPITWVWTQSIAAGATFNPLTDFQYEQPPFPAMVEIFQRATAVGLLVTISSGGQTLQQESPVQAGGTAGSTPARLSTEGTVGKADPSQKVRIGYRNPTGGAITIDGLLVMTPLGSSRGGAPGRSRPSFRRRPARRR